jgi:hypothetical protein
MSRDSAVGITTLYGLDVRSRDSAVGITTGYGLDVRSRDGSVGITTLYGLDRRKGGVLVPVVKNFLFSTSSRPALGTTQPSIQWAPGVKWLGCEADHSPPASTEVKKIWIYTSTPVYVFMA